MRNHCIVVTEGSVIKWASPGNCSSSSLKHQSSHQSHLLTLIVVHDLLSTSVASTQKEQMAEDYVNKPFRLIQTIAENQEPLEITKDLVEITILKIIRKKAADDEKWTNEMILEGGDEVVNSITYMVREISLTQQIPNQLKTMRIKSIHKKGSKLLIDNKRGSFHQHFKQII